MSTEAGKVVTISGWKRSGIFDAIQMGSKGLPSLDPFAEISPLPSVLQEFTEILSLESLFPSDMDRFKERIEVEDEESSEELEYEGGNAFDLFE